MTENIIFDEQISVQKKHFLHKKNTFDDRDRNKWHQLILEEEEEEEEEDDDEEEEDDDVKKI